MQRALSPPVTDCTFCFIEAQGKNYNPFFQEHSREALGSFSFPGQHLTSIAFAAREKVHEKGCFLPKHEKT